MYRAPCVRTQPRRRCLPLLDHGAHGRLRRRLHRDAGRPPLGVLPGAAASLLLPRARSISSLTKTEFLHWSVGREKGVGGADADMRQAEDSMCSFEPGQFCLAQILLSTTYIAYLVSKLQSLHGTREQQLKKYDLLQKQLDEQ
eukprot:1783052-Pleurochrysis_carterae.AAC.1